MRLPCCVVMWATKSIPTLVEQIGHACVTQTEIFLKLVLKQRKPILVHINTIYSMSYRGMYMGYSTNIQYIA